MHASQGFGIGTPTRRKEDQRLITGRGRYSDDLHLPGQARSYMLRSPHAHARILAIDTSAARALPGVLAVLTAADVLADGIRPVPPDFPLFGPIAFQKTMPDPVLLNADGSEFRYDSPYNMLATDRVRFVGDGVAFIVAETVAIAKDAAELIEVEYEVLQSVTATRDAARPGAPTLYDGATTNLVLESEIGDQAATAAAFARAAHVARLETWIQRVTGVPMEVRSAVGEYDEATGRYTLHAGSGGVQRQRREVAWMLGVEQDKVRVVCHDIGGNFGTKNSLFPEFTLVVWAARRLGRPVKWTAERSEALLTDYQGRDLVAEMELALDAEGHFIGLRGRLLSNIGAFASSIIPLRKGVAIATGLYTIPAAYLSANAVLSNTPPTIPYRSAGRPEAMFLIERLADIAATEMGIDRIELRRRNLIRPEQLPYRNATGLTYDNGDYPLAMEKALILSDWAGFPARREESRRKGWLRGIGLANYIEMTMGNPREYARITVLPEDVVQVAVGTLSSGQGHETSFTQCVAEWLGVPFEQVKLVQGDTDVIPIGGGSHSGRSMRMAGFVMGKCCEQIVARGRQIAAEMLDAPAERVEFAAGRFSAPGVARSVDVFDIARAAYALNALDDSLRGPLAGEHSELFRDPGYPYGAAVCELEIDPETGRVELRRWAAVDDVGRAVNPMILDGQTHGAAVQGIGQLLWEHFAVDPESGQVIAGSFMDYAMPRADWLISFDTELMEVPTPTNPLGVRAGGEGGTTPALAAGVNAIVDALSEYGIKHVDMPATSLKIWQMLQGNR